MYYLVNNSNKLNFLIDKILTNNKWLALDTEFHTGRTKLYPTLSTIQLCFPDGKSYVVDCIENNFDTSIEDFINVIENSQCIKVWFSAKQDIIIFNHKASKQMSNIFDIQIAVKALGYRDNIGLAELYENIFHEKTSKAMQKSNWLQRPLSKEQIIYSFLDVYYIYKIYKKILPQICEKKLLANINEKTKVIYSGNNLKYNINKELSKLRLYNSKQNAIALSLFKLRETLAKNHNLSRKMIYENKDIRKIAIRKPTNLKDLFRVKYSRQIKENQAQILNIIKHSI